MNEELSEVYMDTAEAGRRKGVLRRTIQLACKEGRLRAVKAGRDWLIRREDLADYHPELPTR
jgi:excisionase family DNA binding protein